MRVLIIEDEHKIADSTKKGLEQDFFSAEAVYDGKTGLEKALDNNYDVIVLDLMLPEINGMEICKKLRAEKIQTPILMLTAKGQLNDKIEGLNAGADDYLVKPFAFEELLARIKALTRRPKNNTGTVLKNEKIVLNTITSEVTIDNKKIDFSKTEFILLEYFLRHQNMVLSKENIINHAWNFDSEVTPNTVEVYVGYLRKKKINIKTVRGFGYKL
jgi:DNA-binding response OmpR family regulator